MQHPASGGAIAIANYDFRASGTVGKSVQIATAARAAGLPAELWVVRAQGPLLERVPADVPVVEVGGALRLSSRIADLAAAIAPLARALRQRAPTVLLSGGNHFHLPARAALAFSGMRAHTRFGLRVSNSSRHAAAADGTGSKAAAGPLTSLKLGGADFIAAVSADLAQEVRTAVRDAEVTCIPNGCDVAAVRRLSGAQVQHRFFDGQGVVITAMGRVTRQKGFDNLIRALAVLRRGVDARLVIIGAGSKAAIADLQQLAARLGVAAQTDFVGYLDNPFALIARSQLFVSASRWEGSCNALLEALACGVRVVATDCPTGNAELLQQGKFGALAPPDCAAGLAAAMLQELRTDRNVAERAHHLARLDLVRCLDGWRVLLEREYGLAGAIGVQPGRMWT
jgi:glycosyltransferase involved in cell wall biosynthesis